MHRTYKNPNTIGRKFLKDLMKSRELSKFCEANGISFNYAFQVATGRKTPPVKMIFALRKSVNPAGWFLLEGDGEKLPKYEPPELADGEAWDVRKSAGYSRFIEILNDVSQLPYSEKCEFYEKHSFLPSQRYAICTGISSVSFATMQKFQDLISPELWFC